MKGGLVKCLFLLRKLKIVKKKKNHSCMFLSFFKYKCVNRNYCELKLINFHFIDVY